MSDPRLNGSHLGDTRHDLYDAAVVELLNGRGPATAAADPLAPQPRIPVAHYRRTAPPPGGTYTLVSLADGRRHLLRVGINALGRYAENDIVLPLNAVSRRHCVILVHATGGCEVYDTASRNGTLVNSKVVNRGPIFPGDVLYLAGHRFLIAWVGPRGELYDDPVTEQETSCLSGLSPTG